MLDARVLAGNVFSNLYSTRRSVSRNPMSSYFLGSPHEDLFGSDLPGLIVFPTAQEIEASFSFSVFFRLFL